MKESKVLKLLDNFKWLFEKFGVDYPIMRRILQLKLTLDGRRTPTAMVDSAKKKKEDNSFIKSLWFYIIFGIVLVPIVILGDNYLFQMSLVFGVVMFMMIITLVSDFSSVLLDLKDKDIILSKPVEGRTLSMAKTLHIMIYMFYITMAFIGPSLIASLIRHGLLFFIIFFIGIILMDLLIVVITALLYLLILKFFDGEKLKDIINYFQILLTIVISIGYQVIGRLFNISEILGIQYRHKIWHYLIPPIWFGGPFELILKGNGVSHIVIFTVLAILMPIISIIIYNKLTPAFEYNLQKLNETSEIYNAKSKGFNHLLSRLVCGSKEEATFFRFATNMMKKERNFKLRVYPSLGFSLIFPFIFLFTFLKDGGLDGVVPSRVYFSIYFMGFMIPTIISTIGFSGNYKGSWIYRVIPFNNTKDIFKGTMKAAFVSLILPLYVLMGVIFMIIFKGKMLVDLIILLLVLALFMVICFNVLTKRLPFSRPFEELGKGGGVVTMFLVFILFVLGGIHYIATTIKYGSLLYISLLLILNIFGWKKGFDVDWDPSIQE